MHQEPDADCQDVPGGDLRRSQRGRLGAVVLAPPLEALHHGEGEFNAGGHRHSRGQHGRGDIHQVALGTIGGEVCAIADEHAEAQPHGQDVHDRLEDGAGKDDATVGAHGAQRGLSLIQRPAQAGAGSQRVLLLGRGGDVSQ